MVISFWLISRLKITAAMLLWIAALRAMSRPSVDLPTAGRAAMTIIWPGCRPLVSRSRSANPVGMPIIPSPRWLDASISSIVPSMISPSAT